MFAVLAQAILLKTPILFGFMKALLPLCEQRVKTLQTAALQKMARKQGSR